MTQRERWFSTLGLVAAFTLGHGLLIAEQPSTAKQPNIVVFLADDLGWGDLGCYGNKIIQTPNLDKFASQGVRFTQCYSACGVCSPSRSSILTGRTPYRNGVFRWIPQNHYCHLRTSEITIAELLQERGYATCHVGKWHLNGHFNSPKHPQPGDHGFDYWMATQNNAAPSHKNPTNFARNGEPVGPLDGFSAVLVVDEAIHWLRDVRDQAQPFYLQVWTHEPHLPIESDPKFMSLYDSGDEGQRQHHGNVTQLDFAFGRLMTALDEMKLSDQTIVYFTSDNGPEGSGRPDMKNPGSQQDRNRGSTGGLRGRKRDDYEGGIRVPGLVRWPGKIEPGTVSKTPVIGSDLFATNCEIAGIPLPKDRTIDGTSMVAAFAGKPVERAKPMYWRTHISSPSSRVAVRVGDWKILGNDDLTKFELYNLAADEREQNELSEKEPARFEELKKTLLAMDAEVKAEGPDWWKQDTADRPRKK